MTGALFTMPAQPEHVTFMCYGDPAPQGSKTAVYRKNPVTGQRYATGGMRESGGDKLTRWRDQVTAAALARTRNRVAYVVPVFVHAVITVRQPRSGAWAGADWPGGEPDLDKLQRAIGDALKNGKVIADDALIVRWIDPTKVFTGRTDLDAWALPKPGAVISVRAAP
jgi:Holliday junction resolvase RusA-like endonuclease